MHNIQYLDVFGEDTSFLVRGKKNYRTWLGVFLSLLITIASFVLTLIIGQEVYQRKNPIVSISEEFLSYSQVKMVDFSYYILIKGMFGQAIENVNSYYDLKTSKFNMTEDGVPDYINDTSFHPVVKCKSNNFNSIRGKISDSEIERIINLPTYCVNYDEQGILQNTFMSPNSTFLSLNFYICDKTVRSCADNLDLTVKQVVVELYYLSSYIDSNDFTNPVKYYYEMLSTIISDSDVKRNKISIFNKQYISDDGWILENTRKISYYNLGKRILEVNQKPQQSPLLALQNLFESPNIQTKTNRSYMKVQDLFAKIGGIVNALMILVNILFAHYFRYNFNMKLRKHLNPSDILYKEKRSLILQNSSFIKNNLILDYCQERLCNNNNRKNKEDQVKDNDKNHNTLIKTNFKVNDSKINDNTSNYDFKKSENNKLEINKEQGLQSLNKNKFIKNNINSINNSKDNKENKIQRSANNNNTSSSLNPFKNQILTNNYTKPLDEINENDDSLFKRKNNLGNKDEEEVKNLAKNKATKFEHQEINTDQNKQLDCGNSESLNESSIFNFEYVDFSDFNYIKYIFHRLFCTKRLKIYQAIKNEIESLLDFHLYCNFIKHQYLLKDPRELIE